VIIHLTFDRLQLLVAMILSGIAIACWLASKKSIIIDAIVGIVVLLIVVWIIIQHHVF
jgi:hypothetical protein